MVSIVTFPVNTIKKLRVWEFYSLTKTPNQGTSQNIRTNKHLRKVWNMITRISIISSVGIHVYLKQTQWDLQAIKHHFRWE